MQFTNNEGEKGSFYLKKNTNSSIEKTLGANMMV